MPTMSVIPSIVSKSGKKHVSNKLDRLALHCVEQITSRVEGKVVADAAPLWVGDTDLRTVERNPDLWGFDFAEQLTGFVAWKTDWRQMAAGVAITRRHLLHCAHWNYPFAPAPVDPVITTRFISNDGRYFETTIVKEYPVWNEGYMSFGGSIQDLTVFLLADELPEWVNIFPIMVVSDAFHAEAMPNTSKYKMPPIPVVSICQGKSNDYPNQVQVLYVANLNQYPVLDSYQGPNSFWRKHPNPLIYPYYYEVHGGDSGTPAFLLFQDTLYLIGIVTGGGFGLQMAWTNALIAYINELILRVDAAHNISTGLTVTQSPEPTI